MIDRFAVSELLQEWAHDNGYGMPLRDAMAAIDFILRPGRIQRKLNAYKVNPDDDIRYDAHRGPSGERLI